MGKILSLRVKAGQPLFGDDTGQNRFVGGDLRELSPCQMLGHGHRHKGRTLAHIRQHPRDLLFGQRHDLSQSAQNHFRIAGLFADHDDAIVLAIDRQRPALAVEQKTPRRRDQTDVDPVFLCQKQIFLGLADL